MVPLNSLEDNITWQGVNTPNRGFVNDVGGDENTRRLAQNKAQTLKLLLGTIAGYAPVISRLYITNEMKLCALMTYGKGFVSIMDLENLVPLS